MSDLDLETAETRLALEKMLQENRRLNEQIVVLNEKLAISEASASRVTESVTLANSEAEIFRRQAGELKLRLEALGVAAGSGNNSKLEERLLEAVSGLRHSEEERRKVTETLSALAGVAADFAKSTTASDPEQRLRLEAQLRKAQEQLGTASNRAIEAAAAPATLTDGMVISIRAELGLVVANIGQKHGVAVGMPFQVLREDRLIGVVRVVEVRDRIAGAVIQDLSSEKDKIKVGDRLKVAARQ